MRADRLGALLALLPATAWAATPASGGVFGVLASLVLILGGFVLVAWLARRYLPGTARSGVVRVVAVTAVGPRERVVVVEIEDSWLVLGVGGGQVRLLDKRPRAEGRAP